uniref:RDD family protein n=1 Tax=Heterorhabditis bacteriophora TaxID=37862 RepID=A0A1I7WRI9_HETBA
MSISTKSNDGNVLSADKMDTYVKKLLWYVLEGVLIELASLIIYS